MSKTIVIALAAILVQGCSTFTSPKLKSVIEDRVSTHSKPTVGILATTPERRVVLVKMPEQLYCAEPSPDVAENISSALSAALKASTKGKLSDAQTGVAAAIATSVRQLFQRSQGIQLYRDGSFMLCGAFLNKTITKAQWVTQHAILLNAATALIQAEIPELSKRKYDANVDPNGSATTQAGASDQHTADEEPEVTKQPTAEKKPGQ